MQGGFSHLIVDIIDINLQISRLPALRREGDINDNVDDNVILMTMVMRRVILMTMLMTATTKDSLEKLCPQESL